MKLVFLHSSDTHGFLLPTDYHDKAELHQLFFDLRDKTGQTFVIVTHDENLAKITDRTISMNDGLLTDTQPSQPSQLSQSSPLTPNTPTI